MPTILLVLIPWVCGEMVIMENLGKGSRQGDKELTMDEEGESELTELSSMPKVHRAERRPHQGNKAF